MIAILPNGACRQPHCGCILVNDDVPDKPRIAVVRSLGDLFSIYC